MYSKLSGMTGTAGASVRVPADSLIAVIPTHRPMVARIRGWTAHGQVRRDHRGHQHSVKIAGALVGDLGRNTEFPVGPAAKQRSSTRC
jgi:hypothetical protein